MMSQDNRLLPLSPEALDRPLSSLSQPAAVPVAATTSATDPAHLREYLAIVLKRKWLILSLAIVVTSIVAIQMYRQPSIYEAETQVQIEQKNNSVLRTGSVVIEAPRDPTYWNTQLKLLENPTLARQVILALDLQNNPAFLGGQARSSLLSSIRRIFSREQAAPAAPDKGVPIVSDEPSVLSSTFTPEQLARLEPYEDALRGNLTVEPIEKTSLVYIRFRHTNPEMAAKIANTLAAVFIANDMQRVTKGSDKAEETLAQQIADLQLQIQQGQEQRINYMRSHDLPLGEKPGQDFTALRLTTYSSQLQAAEAERKDAQAIYDAAMNTDDIWSIPQVQGDKVVQRVRERVATLEEQRAALSVNYTPEYAEIKKIDEQIKQLKQDMKKAPQEVLTSMRVRLDAAKKKEAKARGDYERERAAANSQSVSETGLSDLKQRLETNRQMYNTYLQRQKELQVTSGDRAQQNVTQVMVARQPHEPIGPARGKAILVALMLSLGAGIGLAILLDYLDDTLKSSEDVDRYIHLPTLALIPAPRSERTFLKGRNLPAPEAGDSTALALIEDVRSPVAEAYRHLRTSLLLSSAGQPPRTVLVTSSQPSEGKTTTAVNIATMLAQTGADVLILDCDLRRPRIHAHFGLPNVKGVANFLSGDTNLDSLIQSYDKEKLPNLKVLTSGPVPPNAAELLGSDEMRKLLYALSEKFTHIIIDSPPAISFTDASILSTMVDGVMLVVHGGRSSRSVVRRAKQQLMDVGAHIFGIVLNNVKLESNDYYYYSGYYSGYYANEEEANAPEDAEAAGANGRGAS